MKLIRCIFTIIEKNLGSLIIAANINAAIICSGSGVLVPYYD